MSVCIRVWVRACTCVCVCVCVCVRHEYVKLSLCVYLDLVFALSNRKVAAASRGLEEKSNNEGQNREIYKY